MFNTATADYGKKMFMGDFLLFFMMPSILFIVAGSNLISYINIYRKAKTNWIFVEGIVVDVVFYGRTFGGVPTVEYYFDNIKHTAEVIKSQFSKSQSEDSIGLYVDPINTNKCLESSRSIYLKMLLLLTLLISIVLTFYSVGIYYLISE